MVGVSAEDSQWQAVANKLKHFPKLLGSFVGGETRAHTVLNGLHALAGRAKPQDFVMVHDAVRPCLRAEDIDRLIGAVKAHADGGLLALPVADTVKRVDGLKNVIETVSRANLWRALTPQMFSFQKLKHAIQESLIRGVDVTDEASAIEAVGDHPMVVAGHPDNIKITVPEDLPLAELFLRQQRRA